MSQTRTLTLADDAATVAAGRHLAAALLRVRPAGFVVYLEGDLGAGKTTFARGVLAGLGHDGRVPSPTYTLIEPYAAGGLTVQHIDLYRLQAPDEVAELGIAELAGPDSCLLIEWPERGAGALPAADLTVSLGLHGAGRRLTGASGSPAGAAVIENL